MKWGSMLAIFSLFWVLSCFLVMPFGLRTHADVAGTEDAQERVPGQVDSAPINFNPRRIALRALMLATLFFALFYANYLHHWITARGIVAVLPGATGPG
ncbi:MAG: DUF1467 family protein [Proteobacteria bacterium]|nr:DUF1467 family protein [Pseudomonadota bacterium]